LFASLLTDPLTYLTALAGLGDAVAFGAPTYLAKKIYGDDENAALIEQATQTGSYKSAAVGGMLIGGVQNVAAKGVVVVEKAGAKAFVKIARNPAVAERMANKWLGKGVHRFLTDRKTSEIRGLINDKTGKFVRFPHIDSGTPMLHWNFEGAGKNIHVIINP
jgi:hypothetical protein